MAENGTTGVSEDEAFYTIGETARLAGVNQAAVRLWEREGLISPQRTQGGHRMYTAKDVARLRRIAWLRRVEKLNAAAIRRELGAVTPSSSNGSSGIDSTLGPRLRTLRDKQGLSLHELAAKTGLSASFFSAVERGQSGISMISLAKVADALGTTVPKLGTGYRQRPRRMVRRSDRPRYVAEDQLLSIEDLIAEPSALVAQLVRVAPRRARRAAHIHDGEEFVHVLSGQITYWLDEREHYRLDAGDSLHMDGGQAHRWQNEGDVPSVLLRIILPPADASRARGTRRTGDAASASEGFGSPLYPPFDDFL